MIERMTLPALGEDVDSGQLVRIAVTSGDRIEQGQILFEIETDKVVVEVPAPSSGTVESVLVSEGAVLHTGDPLITIARAENNETPAADQTVPEPELPGDPEIPAPTREPAAKPEPLHPLGNTDAAMASRPRRSAGARAPAGPASRQLARKLAIDIARVPGSGPRGRISKSDVLAFARDLINNSTQSPAQPLPPGSGIQSHRSPDALTLATARNMQTTWQQVPHAWISADIDITLLENQRRSAATRHSLNSHILLAVATALADSDKFNTSWDAAREELAVRQSCDIGVAVDTPRGLIVPVLRDVSTLSLAEVDAALKQTAIDARNSRLNRANLQGGSITISNLGGFNLSAIQPVVNWPQSSILGVASAQWRMMRDDRGEWREAQLLPVTLGFDHRIINGADAARFLGIIRQCLEQPQTPSGQTSNDQQGA